MEHTPDPEGLSVHLVRHGETASYGYDAGLTELGHEQARLRGVHLARTLRVGEHVAFGFAPTERARITTEVLREALVGELAPDTGARIGGPGGVEPGYRNLQVWVDGEPHEPTRTRSRLEKLLTVDVAERPGWVMEAERFWHAHEVTGDAMGFWLTTPLVWHESPGSVVARVLQTTAARVDAGTRGRLVVGTHSGLLRAVVHWASGSDPGEPENAEEVVVTAAPSGDAGTVSFRDGRWPVRLPRGGPDWERGLRSTDGR